MSDSLWTHGLQPTRLLCPRDFSRQGYWSGLPFPSPGDLPNPGIEPGFPVLKADYLLTELQGKGKLNVTGNALMLWGSFASIFSEGIPGCNAMQHVTQHHRELAHNAAVQVGMSSQSALQNWDLLVSWWRYYLSCHGIETACLYLCSSVNYQLNQIGLGGLRSLGHL